MFIWYQILTKNIPFIIVSVLQNRCAKITSKLSTGEKSKEEQLRVQAVPQSRSFKVFFFRPYFLVFSYHTQ